MENRGKIAPCPFSTRYLIDADQAWRSLTVFLLYRLGVGGVLLFLFFLKALPAFLGKFSPSLYAATASLYLASALLSVLPLVLRRPSFGLQAQLQILADLALLPFIMHASGGVGSGVGVLLGLSMVAGGILVGGPCALAFAALATVAVLTEEVYAELNELFEQSHLTYAGMLGASYFGIALLALVLARQTERSEAVAVQRGADIANLQRINEFVIQHLQSGILAIDEAGGIRMANGAAVRLLGLPSSARPSLESACPDLSRFFLDWLADSRHDSAILSLASSDPIQVRFIRLGLVQPPVHMVFLEDSALHRERVQQSKLASLGRLAASIAHEIRNPLSAISHAGQLLAENSDLENGDRRLVQIVLDHAARVNSVIENILQMSRRDPARRETLPLGATLARFLRDFEAQQGIAPGVFRLEPSAEELRVLVDPSHLKQIFENLCSNALKYGNPQLGSIGLRIGRRRGEPCFEILDHAPPIEAKIARNLFEPFFTTSSSGTGLGLYISRELAELNQARLEYSDLGEGGQFRLYLSDAERTVLKL